MVFDRLVVGRPQGRTMAAILPHRRAAQAVRALPKIYNFSLTILGAAGKVLPSI
jgi:hypothetical protein